MENIQNAQDIFDTTCTIETELNCALDILEHVVYGIGEGLDHMTANVQIGSIKGAIAMIQQQAAAVARLRTVKK